LARALIVGCGCRGRALGLRLAADGWAVRGTSRSEAGVEAIERAGIEGAHADPDRVATVLDHVHDVAVVSWLLASAGGGAADVAALHGPRLERLLSELVDTPVRSFVYEARGSASAEVLEAGRAAVEAASERWRIPAAFIDADPGEPEDWIAAGVAAVERSLAG
jgi:nucleoside-diphosphate-sugar epimerase